MQAERDDDRGLVRSRVVQEHLRCECAHDLEGILDTVGTETRFDDEAWGIHRMGHDEARSRYRDLLEAIPDIHNELVRWYITDDAVVAEEVMSGTHTGTWRGLPGTGRRIKLPVCVIYIFDEHDRIGVERVYYDRSTLLRQLGLFWDPATLVGRVITVLTHPLTFARAFGRSMFAK